MLLESINTGRAGPSLVNSLLTKLILLCWVLGAPLTHSSVMLLNWVEFAMVAAVVPLVIILSCLFAWPMVLHWSRNLIWVLPPVG